jgi:hypothetical protein
MGGQNLIVLWMRGDFGWRKIVPRGRGIDVTRERRGGELACLMSAHAAKTTPGWRETIAIATRDHDRGDLDPVCRFLEQ